MLERTTMSGSVSNVVNKFEGKNAQDGPGDGHAAWQTMNEKYNSHIKENRRACHEKLFNIKMEPGQDPDDLFFVLNGCRDLLEEMVQTVHDERYEDILLHALLAKYERGRNASYEKRNFGLVDIRHIHGTYHVRRQPFAPFPLQAGCRPRHRHAGSRAHQQRRTV